MGNQKQKNHPKKHTQRKTPPRAWWIAGAALGGVFLVAMAFFSEPILVRLTHWRPLAHPAVGPIAQPQQPEQQTASAAPQPQPVTTSQPSSHDYTIPAIQDGMVPVINRIPTKQPVVFLTIDDGIVTNPGDTQLMQASRTKATFFLVYRFIKSDPSFFANLSQQTGSDIQNHSYDHYLLTNLTYDQQKTDICQNADIFTEWFGKRPVLFRPSGGAYNSDTLRAAAACNMKALVMWDASINNGAIAYQNGHMHAGDIVLMHFRSTFAEDLNAFVTAARAAGLQPDLLVNWVSQ